MNCQQTLKPKQFLFLFQIRLVNIRTLMFFLLYIPVATLAANQDLGIGRVAQNLMDPVSTFSDFVDTACILVGGSFLLASIIKYFEHRQSPLMVPLSTVVFLFIAGLALLLLPLLSIITSSGVKYSLISDN